MLLKDKVIFLTGGSTGIGWECAKAYAAEGALVTIVARGKEGAASVASELGSSTWGFPAMFQSMRKCRRLSKGHLPISAGWTRCIIMPVLDPQ